MRDVNVTKTPDASVDIPDGRHTLDVRSTLDKVTILAGFFSNKRQNRKLQASTNFFGPSERDWERL